MGQPSLREVEERRQQVRHGAVRGRRRAVGREWLQLEEAVERQEEGGGTALLPRGIGDREDEVAEQLQRPVGVPLGEDEENETLLEATLG